MYELHLLADGGPRRLAPIGTTPLLLGRSGSSDIVLDDDRVSARHLRLWCEGDRVYVRDLGSRNGTKVAGEPLRGDRAVDVGESIEIGAAITVQVALVQRTSPPPSKLGPAIEEALSRLGAVDPSLAQRAEQEIRTSVEVSRTLERIDALLPQLISAGRPSAVLKIAVDEVKALTGAPLVAAVSRSGGSATHTASAGDLTGIFPIDTVPSSVITQLVGGEGRAIWSDDALSDPRFSERLSVQALALVSIGAVPLGSLAVLYLSDPGRAGAFSPGMRASVEIVCRLAGHFLERPRKAPKPEALPGMVGQASAMGEVFDTVRAFSPMPWPMLVLGETGTGKELIARAIHDLSGRASAHPQGEAPFVAVNCGALSDELALSQLFGHEPGAFTGADRRHIGYLERAGKGTLFLDEVGELSPVVQARLLRVLQEGVFERLGGERPIPFSARVVAATHRPLDDPGQRAPFRDDLFHRLAACVIHVPALRERPEDIGLLAEVLLERILAELPRGTRLSLSDAAVRTLQSKSWPGNVRELENALRGATARAIARRSDRIEPEHLDAVAEHKGEAVDDLHAATLAFQTRRAREMLAATGENVAEAARRLGVSRQFLYRLFARVDGSAPK